MVLALGALTPVSSGAQQYKQTPVDQCFNFISLRIGRGAGNSLSPLTHELAAKGAGARALCEQALKDRPNEGRLHASLARLRAIAGERAGALEAARAGVALRDRNARVLLGVMLAEGQRRDYAAAREQFRLAARDESAFAQFNLGAILANGWGVEVDEPDAAAAFQRAAKEGDPLAMQILGQRYDKANAEQWFRQAAELQITEGVREPLRIADLGRAKLDSAALLAWYEAKARAAEPWAQGYLGALYEAGQWVKQDDAAAALWYRQAGEAGNTLAQWRMAAFYREGRAVPQDKAEADRWSMMWLIKRCDDHERAGAGANACDRLAADGFDPQRAAAGVESFCMRHFAERAVAACRAAVNASPGTVRYRTQLARSLAHTGRFDEARREASGAAAAGSTAAMILLGVMSQRGLGGPKDEAAGVAWYTKAADAGDDRGAALINRHVTVRAAPTIAERAAAGDMRSQFNLAAQLEQEKKYDEAMKWYARAAAQGFGVAELNLAQMYEMGIGVQQDTAEARKRYRKLAGTGDGEARWRAARLAGADKDYDEAFKLYSRSVRDDDYRAFLDLGQMYEQGHGVKKDVRRAVELYERVAERSNWANAKLGALYLQGEGIPKDYDKARARLQRAAGAGNAAARNNLGLMYDRGLGVGVNHTTAVDLYFAALEGGSVQARGNLESLFAEGRGAPEGAAALHWYRRGADAEIASAQYQLGRMYAKGDVVARNDRIAVEWLIKAAQQGHPEARKEAVELVSRSNDQQVAALRPYLIEPRTPFPPPPVYPDGIALDPGTDQSRDMPIRVGGVGDMQAQTMNAATANPWDIIRWYP